MPPLTYAENRDHLRCWAEIDLAALFNNIDVAHTCANDAPLVAVIKANAYGHGVLEVARTLAAHHAVSFFGVANAAEARQLTGAGITEDTRLYLLGPSAPGEREEIVRNRWTPCVSSLREARHLDELARTLTPKDPPLPVHLAIDTGMGRGGFLPENLPPALTELLTLSHLHIEGIGSHFPCADEDPEFTHTQIQAFTELFDRVHPSLPRLAHLHLHNSAGLLGDYEIAPCNLARPGLMLYGVSPLPNHQHRLQPVLTLKARVTLIRDLPAGHGVSYGRTFITDKPTRVATLGIGYGDGYPRHLSGQDAQVLLHGKRCPLLGRVTMDQIMIDVTHLDSPPVTGDEAVLIGSQEDETIHVSELAQKSNTIPWEILTRLTPRVPRLYL